jgi:hypothetical protein
MIPSEKRKLPIKRFHRRLTRKEIPSENRKLPINRRGVLGEELGFA